MNPLPAGNIKTLCAFARDQSFSRHKYQLDSKLFTYLWTSRSLHIDTRLHYLNSLLDTTI